MQLAAAVSRRPMATNSTKQKYSTLNYVYRDSQRRGRRRIKS